MYWLGSVGLVLVVGACVEPNLDLQEGLDLTEEVALVATTDFSVGALATVSLSEYGVSDLLTATSGDPRLVMREEGAFLLNRGSGDHIRRYEWGAWESPVLEFATTEGGNPHDVVTHEDRVFVSLYERDYISVHHLDSGAELDRVELSKYSGKSDGLPETDQMMIIGDRLYVALQQLDRTKGWSDEGGQVIEVDLDTLLVVNSWEVGPNPKIYAHPSESDGMVIMTGVYGLMDGGIRILYPSLDILSDYLLTEAELGGDLEGYAETLLGDSVFSVVNMEGMTQAYCWHWKEPSYDLLIETDGWIADIKANHLGQVWMAGRRGVGENPFGGLMVSNPSTCDLVMDSWVQLVLEPYSLIFSTILGP